MAIESIKRPDALRLSDLQKLYMQAYSSSHKSRLTKTEETQGVQPRRKNQPFRLRRPLPISTQFYEWFGYLYGRFQIGIFLLPFRAALRCELGFTPPFGLTTLIIYSFPAYPL